MKVKLLAASVLSVCCFSSSAFAQDKIELNYDGFFDRMKDIEEAEYQGVKLAFYLRDKAGQACPVKSAKLATKLKEKEVYVLETGEILLPYAPKFDQDKANLVIEKQDDRECGLTMSLESNVLFDANVPQKQALDITNKLALAFDDLGGMMSFMLPKVEGITFKFEEGTLGQLTNSNIAKCEIDTGCTIMASDLESFKGQLSFNKKPVKAVPFIQ